ncbi:hypothetical protein [Streptomyces sp. SID6139]|uniref:hypothetical protein n=1 Tax=Streptomyces sp. SID6139 TaxID=2690320 RepID=UPI001368F73A|nr:hypothetical protein [Streptomyces sp. SID6139]
MVPTEVAETLPELVPFARAVQARRPEDGTWCEAWTVRDVLIHQTGTPRNWPVPLRRSSRARLWRPAVSIARPLITGRAVTAPFFAEHMREELIQHGWGLTGDGRTTVRPYERSTSPRRPSDR